MAKIELELERARLSLAKHRELSKAAAELQDQLRELLSYCETQAGEFDPDNIIEEFNPYDDVVYKLRGILDGE